MSVPSGLPCSGNVWTGGWMFPWLPRHSSMQLSPCSSQTLWSTQQVSTIFLLSSSLQSFLFRSISIIFSIFQKQLILHSLFYSCRCDVQGVSLLVSGFHEPLLHGGGWITDEVMFNITAKDLNDWMPFFVAVVVSGTMTSANAISRKTIYKELHRCYQYFITFVRLLCNWWKQMLISESKCLR